MNKARTIFFFLYVIPERKILKNIDTNLEKNVLFAQLKQCKVNNEKSKHILGNGNKGEIFTKRAKQERKRAK